MAADRQFSMKVKLSCTTLKKFRKEERHWLKGRCTTHRESTTRQEGKSPADEENPDTGYIETAERLIPEELPFIELPARQQ